ncbi:MAG TPA: exodeoxyribonuclease III [Acidimicrobiales bacterium]|nr:exodeoxyribonuclease III [Acidimicrobiales bacterium]
MRIATWNVASLRPRLERVEAWLAANEPDVCCLQETKCSDEAFPTMAFAALDYEAAHHGNGQWNGVAILSKVGLEGVRAGFTGPRAREDDEARLLVARCGGVEIASMYVPNGKAVGHESYVSKLDWLDRLSGELEASFDPSSPAAFCGDYNIAPEDRDVWDISQFEGATHVSAPERAAFARLLEWGLVDSTRYLRPDEVGPFSWWDYRAGAFHKGWGMRIDLVLVTRPLVARLESAHVDRDARKRGIKAATAPSDHAPVVVDLSD